MINKCLQPIIDNDGIKILKIITLCLTAYALFRLMQGAYYMVQWDFPNHCLEAVENVAAISFWQGKSPYYENFPHNYSSYGPLYYLFTSLFLSSDSFYDVAFVQRTILESLYPNITAVFQLPRFPRLPKISHTALNL